MKQYIHKLLPLMLLISFLPLNSSAQNQNFKFSVSYKTGLGDSQASLNLHRKTASILSDVLINEGGVKSEVEGFTFFFDISIPNEDGYQSLSFTLLQRIQDPVVEVGKKEQIFYSLSSNEIPATENEQEIEMREYISEDYMRQFVMVMSSETAVTSEKYLESDIKKLATKLLKDGLIK